MYFFLKQPNDISDEALAGQRHSQDFTKYWTASIRWWGQVPRVGWVCAPIAMETLGNWGREAKKIGFNRLWLNFTLIHLSWNILANTTIYLKLQLHIYNCTIVFQFLHLCTSITLNSNEYSLSIKRPSTSNNCTSSRRPRCNCRSRCMSECSMSSSNG